MDLTTMDTSTVQVGSAEVAEVVGTAMLGIVGILIVGILMLAWLYAWVTKLVINNRDREARTVFSMWKTYLFIFFLSFVITAILGTLLTTLSVIDLYQNSLTVDIISIIVSTLMMAGLIAMFIKDEDDDKIGFWSGLIVVILVDVVFIALLAILYFVMPAARLG